MPARKRGESSGARASFKGTGMLKKSLILIVLSLSTASHALTRAGDSSLFSRKAEIQKSLPAHKIKASETEVPRPRMSEELDYIGSELPEFDGMIARRHHTQPKKSARGASLHAEKAAGGNSEKMKIYRVRKGDTVYSIARKFEISQTALCARNNISPSSPLMAGQRLKIPALKNKAEASAQKNESSSSAPPSTSVRFAWPLRSIFSVHRDAGSGVRPLGIVIDGSPRAPVVSAARGTVEKIGTMRGYGRYVIIKHESHFLTVYSGLKDIFVGEGDEIRRGKKIGTHEGSLHFQINRAGRPINPLELLPERENTYPALAR